MESREQRDEGGEPALGREHRRSEAPASTGLRYASLFARLILSALLGLGVYIAFQEEAGRRVPLAALSLLLLAILNAVEAVARWKRRLS